MVFAASGASLGAQPSRRASGPLARLERNPAPHPSEDA